ncbi:MAG: alpha amylase C-terminal domain-containing protein [Lachnospiraceae bacterium]|nr:alpha amylase C-terminal domain-containing protein [Lachnospiraceae bacterium]
MAECIKKRILEIDPYLTPYEKDIDLRMKLFAEKRDELTGKSESLVDFANGYKYFGFHRTKTGWVYREWAPAAEKMYLTGDFNGWDVEGCPMERLKNGVFEVHIEGKDTLCPGQKVQAIIVSNGQWLRRIPLYATRVVQDPVNYLWCAEIEDTFEPYPWTDGDFAPEKTPFIYECHIGMAQEKGAVGTYREFREYILPRIKELGYNTIQIMAIMEHPYYGSFGYQVSNFFAASSRYGTSRDLKELVNAAHEMGIAVLLDVVHSHAVKNTNEGLNEFDGTVYQFFHEGGKGDHREWGTKLFNYGKNEVLHFLLSNLKYWMEVFHFDGFRFDGVTSMLYHDHGLGSAFTDYSMYFSMNTDTEAVTYLQLANELIHQFDPRAITVAEDMSGMPGMCLPIPDGGIGFDYRLSMGVPDLWIKTLKETTDDHWDMAKLWYELTGRRPQEKNIGYCESHDQALVGDKTIMFRLCDAEMYTHMNKFGGSLVVDRGIALHKMIRLLTASLAGEGYLNFMGNEFGHPEWIDFPREGNGWSYHYCRRQWSLVDNPDLRYRELNAFDKAMIKLLKDEDLLEKKPENRWMHQDDKIMIYTKGDTVFAFNFHPTKSFDGYFIPVGQKGTYQVVLSSDDGEFGGFSRVDTGVQYEAVTTPANWVGFRCYLPNRSAVVLKRTATEAKEETLGTGKVQC